MNSRRDVLEDARHLWLPHWFVKSCLLPKTRDLRPLPDDRRILGHRASQELCFPRAHPAQKKYEGESMKTRRTIFLNIFACVMVMAWASTCAFAQTVASVANPCARFRAGSVIHQPPALFSYNGVLNVQF